MGNKREAQILKLLEKNGDKSLSESAVMKELGLSEKKRKSVREALAEMKKRGEVKRTGKGRYRVAGDAADAGAAGSAGSGKRRGAGSSAKKKGPKTSANGAAGGNSVRLLAGVRKTADGYLACPRNPELPDFAVENGSDGSFSPGELVLVELRRGGGAGKVVERLGISGEAETEKKGIMREYSLPLDFPRKVAREAEAISGEISNGELSRRVSLEKETVFTIDGEDAKDFDDAVGIRKIRGRGYRLWVSIADVSHYVTPGSACDREAARRATSTYLSDRVIPMLPEKLSNDLCSLRPDRRRFTKTVEMDFDSSGRLVDSKVYNSVIKSAARLTYSQAWSVLGRKSGNALPGQRKIVSSLRTMKELYEKLKKLRIENGGLDFDFPEAVLLRDSSGGVTDVARTSRNAAHEIIEEFMIAANSAVAGFIFRNSFESIYRIHEPPDGDSVAKLREDLLKVGVKADFRRKVAPSDVQAVMRAVSERKDREQVNVMILRALKKAVYSTRHVPHFGLAIDDYTHFTSPIRRYSDLVVHRILNDILGRKAPSYALGSLKSIAEHCSEAERRAEDAERRFMDLESACFMKDRVGGTFHAKIVSIHPFGVFVEIREHFVEGLIPERFYKGRGRKRRKWFELGDELRVKLVEADVEKRRLTFDLAS